METLYEDIKCYICKFLHIKEIHTMEYVSKDWNTRIMNAVYISDVQKEKLLLPLIPFSDYIPDKIFDIIGGIKKYYELPFYLGEHYTRDYVDYIFYNKIDHPVSRGIACGNRNFLCFKLKFVTDNKTYFITVILFQRYTNEHKWTTASNTCGIFDEMFREDHDIFSVPLIKRLLIDGKLSEKNTYWSVEGNLILG